MRRLIFCSIALVLFTSSLLSQTIYYETIINPFWDFYSRNYLSVENAGKGYTGVASEDGLLSSTLNPASFNPGKKYSAEISYGLQTNTKYLPGIDDIILKNNFPSGNIAVGYRYNDNFSIGLKYGNDNNYKLDFGEMSITNELGVEIGKSDLYESFNTHTFSIPVVYSSKYFNLGINLNLIIFHSNMHGPFTNEQNPEGFGVSDITSDNTQFIPDFGIILKPLKNLSLGFTFTPRSEFEISRNFDQRNEITKTFIPMKISAGAAYKFFDERLSIEANYRYENTSKKLEDIRTLPYQILFNDRNDFNIGLDYLLNKNINLRTGFFTLLNKQIYDSSIIAENLLDQYFLTLGGSYRYKDFSFELAILSSEIIHDKKAGHTNFVLGVKYSFE